MMRRWWWSPILSVLLTTGACGSDPGVSKDDCPGTPKITALDQPGPYWDGLQRIHFTVPGGTPSSIQVQTFNPAVGTWSGFSSGFLEQEDDDSYVASASITPTDGSQSAAFKLRVRALLDACPPTDWATTEEFPLGDPITATSWKAHVDPMDVFVSFVQVNLTLGTGTTAGPYTLAAGGIDHTMRFLGSGVVDELWSFGIDSPQAGDLYAGCKFSIHYVGKWHWTFTPSFRITVTDMVPAPTPLAGSTCANPPITDMAYNQAGFTSRLSQTVLFPNIDYSRLTFVTPGKAVWQENQLIEDLNQLFSGLSDNTGADQSNLQSSMFFNSGVFYTKQ